MTSLLERLVRLGAQQDEPFNAVKEVAPVTLTSCAAVELNVVFFFSSRRRHTRSLCDWSSDVCSSDLLTDFQQNQIEVPHLGLSSRLTECYYIFLRPVTQMLRLPHRTQTHP